MITAYLKPTNFCNVGCTHCYLTEEVRADRTKMGEEQLYKTATLLKQMASAQKAERVHIIWHGGEPLVLGRKYFEMAGAILDEVLPNHTESLQTSLIPLKQEHIEWIQKRLGSVVGSSMDFSSRTTKEGPLGYQKLWLQKVKMCRDAGIEVIPGVTPSKLEIKNAAGIVQWMSENGFARFNIERYNSFGFKAPFHPNNKEHADFLWDLFGAIMHLHAQGKAPAVRVIGAVIGGILFGSPGDRWGGSCQKDFIVIEPNGDLNNCPDKSSKEPAYANIEDGFVGFQQSPLRRKWIRIQNVGHTNLYCGTCENNAWCKSGCPITCNEIKEGSTECSGYKSFITRVRQYLAQSSEQELLARTYLEKIQQSSGSLIFSEGS